MPTFNVLDKFSPDRSFSQVNIGEDAFLLDVELNEMQKIQKYQSGLMARKLMTNGFLARPTITLVGGVLTIPADVILANGDFVDIMESMTLAVSTNDVVYLAISEAEITSLSTIKRSGNLSGGSTLTNDLIDTRVGSETSRRTQKQVQLVKSNADGTKVYLPVATITGTTTFVDNRLQLGFNSPSLTGVPTAPTASAHSNTTQVANTAYVTNEIIDTQMILSMGGLI